MVFDEELLCLLVYIIKKILVLGEILVKILVFYREC